MIDPRGQLIWLRLSNVPSGEPHPILRLFATSLYGYDAFVSPNVGENYQVRHRRESLSLLPCHLLGRDAMDRPPGGGKRNCGRDLTSAGLAAHLQRLALMSTGERVDAKKSAADMYLTWRKQQLDENILDEARLGLARP